MLAISSTESVQMSKCASLNISRGLILVLLHVYLTLQTHRAISQTGLHIKLTRKMAGLLNLSSILLMIILHKVSGQQCNVPGICSGQLLGSLETNDRNECLSECSNLEDCSWFSSNEEDGFCGLFQTCDDVSTTNCPQCISGEHSCPVLRCNLIGECQGTLIGEDIMATEELCQGFCTSFTGCAFYTFHKNTGLCLLFEDCPELHDCQNCVSGEPGCYVEDQTTVQPSSTSAFPGTTTITSDCPDGWVLNWELGKCYYLIDDYYTWYEASNFCKELDSEATLTSVRSEQENHFVWAMIPISSLGAWIGGKDDRRETVWRWVNLKILLSVISALRDCHQSVIG